MNKKIGIIVGVLAFLLIITGVVVYKAVFSGKPATQVTQDLTPVSVPTVDSSISVNLTKSTTADNTIVISVKGLGSKMTMISYELTYDSQGLIKGVNSGSKPADVTGKDAFEREIYLGTCSRNVCKPDTGVSKVTLNLEFTDSSGKKSQFSKDYTL
ncbi:MAG: hypothetical protein NTY06_01685 [Candidatus Gottesmanbacteria bacterium]|nr:hypothetical protein [Candidatus Gottesmanbacteria bacterium]